MGKKQKTSRVLVPVGVAGNFKLRQAGRADRNENPGLASLLALLLLPLSSCNPRKEDLTKYASTFEQSWQGRALRLEGVPKTHCVQFSTNPGSCVVFKRNDNKTIEKHVGTCEVEGSVTGKYVSLNCRKGDGKSEDAPCVPGDNKIVINLNAALKLDGTEPDIVDSSLARSIVPFKGTCD